MLSFVMWLIIVSKTSEISHSSTKDSHGSTPVWPTPSLSIAIKPDPEGPGIPGRAPGITFSFFEDGTEANDEDEPSLFNLSAGATTTFVSFVYLGTFE